MKRHLAAALCCSAGLAFAQSASAPTPASPATPAAPGPAPTAAPATPPTPAAAASAPVSAAKRELVRKLLVVQQSGIDSIARSVVEQPAVQMSQGAGRALQQVPADKREAVGKAIDADFRKYIDEATPLVHEHAVKLAPSTIGAVLEERFSDDELKQLIAWFDSPLSKKFSQYAPQMQSTFSQRLMAESRPLLEPKLQALDAKIRSELGLPPATPAGPAGPAGPGAGPGAGAKASAPAPKASSK